MRMVADGAAPNRYVAHVTPDTEGEWTFEIHSWSDPVATWQHDAGIKIPAGVDVELMFTEARLLLERVAAGTGPDTLDSTSAALVKGAIAAASDTERPVGARLARPAGPRAGRRPARPPAARADLGDGPVPLPRRPRARPLRQLVRVLPPLRGRHPRPEDRRGHHAAPSAPRPSGSTRVAEMGFDVIYLPPIHPIGEVNRKGPNNTLTPGPDDPGSPWAIGSKDGGHDAIHPELGTFEDFDAFVARAGELGLEVALDLALQAAPDHPWVTDAPAVLHHARRRHDRLRREPAEEVPGHLPDQLRQRPERHLPRGAADREAVDRPTACGSSASTTRTPSRWPSGSGCSPRCGVRTPTSSSCPRRSPSRR